MARSIVLVTLAALAAPLPGAAGQRTPVEGPEARPQGEVELLVVDHDGRPLPDAYVRIALQELRADVLPASLASTLLEQRPSVQTDSKGRFRAIWPKESGLLVSGRQEDEWGFRWFPPGWRETQGHAHPPGDLLDSSVEQEFEVFLTADDLARALRMLDD